tara:strand:+ start:143 stop:736 length:594 start_codon:yes stop_codon:yes gene_type:complete
MSILSIDIETGNTAADIGGWYNSHMWKVTCVTTWDGSNGTVYMDNDIEMKEDINVKSLKQLKYDLDDHFQKGGKLLGHNINAFDLPALRDSMDIYIVRKYLEDKENRCIDTSALVTKSSGKRVQLDNLVKCTLKSSKSANGLQAVKWWQEGEYTEIAKYCLMDSKLTYDLWQHGVNKGNVEYFDEDNNIINKIDIEW